MLTSKEFWIGFIAALILYYLYTNHFKKGMGG